MVATVVRGASGVGYTLNDAEVMGSLTMRAGLCSAHEGKLGF